MKTRSLLKATFILSAGILLFGFQAVAQPAFTFQSGSMTISGTSSLHDWESNVETIHFFGKAIVQNQELKALDEIKMVIPVEGIKSQKGKIMDNKTHDALKMEDFPNIEYSINTYKITPLEGRFRVNAIGELTIAGMTRSAALVVTASFDDQGLLTFEGSKALKMTDYNITPPKALLGTLKTGDDISIHFKVKLKAETTTANN